MSASILVVLPCHAGDVERAETLLWWLDELGGAEKHSLLIAADAGVPTERVKKMLEAVRRQFHSVKGMVVPTGVVGWPLAANLMFRAVARQVQDAYKLPWLWLESDAVPLREGWLDELGEAYRRSPRPLLGCVLDAERPIEGLPARYLAGVAVYPQDTYGLLADRWKDAKFAGMAKPPKLATAQWQKDVRAWDMVFADALVPRAHNTPLIQHHWGTAYDQPPLFVASRTEADPANAVTLELVRKDAVLFHRVKDLDGFLALWRVRMAQKMAKVTEALKPTGASQYVLEKALEAGLITPPAELPEPPPQAPTPEPAPGEPPVGFKGAGADATNWKGGPEADKARREARARESREYLAESRRKAQEARQAQRAQQPASV